MTRVFAYIDGFNLYGGLKQRKWRQFYWIDPFKLVQALTEPGESLAGVKYFTTRVRQPEDTRRRQGVYLDALAAISKAQIVEGKFLKRSQQCRQCNAQWVTFEEKMTDSAIASHFVADALRDRFDVALLIGGDTDIVPAIQVVKDHCPTKQIRVWFPPARSNQDVGDNCHASATIHGGHLASALMPDVVPIRNGLSVVRPAQWCVR